MELHEKLACRMQLFEKVVHDQARLVPISYTQNSDVKMKAYQRLACDRAQITASDCTMDVLSQETVLLLVFSMASWYCFAEYGRREAG